MVNYFTFDQGNEDAGASGELICIAYLLANRRLSGVRGSARSISSPCAIKVIVVLEYK